jgi:hypothetical protein
MEIHAIIGLPIGFPGVQLSDPFTTHFQVEGSLTLIDTYPLAAMEPGTIGQFGDFSSRLHKRLPNG